MENNTIKEPSPLLSLVPILVLVGLLFMTIRIFGSDALSGGSQIVLLATTAVCCLLAMTCCKVKWASIEAAITKNVAGITPALFILLLIGALSGSWMISGVVPTLIYYGLQIIHPDFYLVSACVICAVVSLVTGSSWTTIATIGIALMGIGQAQGFSMGWIAGAIISGAYFGDKMSPLSDTTILASSTTGTPLFTHIRYMVVTTVPSILITLVVFTVAGFMYEVTATAQVTLYAAVLKETFHISWWLLTVPAVTVILIVKRVPSLVVLFLSAALAGVVALIAQPHLLHEITGKGEHGFVSSFKGLWTMFYGGTHIDTGNVDLNGLVATRGMSGMLDTIWLILCAMAFGGAMTASGMLKSIISVFLRFMKRRAGMVSVTALSGIFFNLTAADQYISIILSGNMFKEVYRKNGYETRLLSRTIEDAVTVTSPLVPWNTCGLTQAAILGVSILVYFPYCFFNLISPLMSIVIAALGYKIIRTKPD